MEGATTTDYILDGQSVVRTLVNNVVDRTYLHGARGPEYERIAANDPVWYLYDGLGSVLGTVDQNGTVVSTRKYDVYGAVRGSTGPSGTKHKFVGSLGHPSEDETGLVYMRARYYDPVTGRFASEDPALVGSNWFAYCENTPTNRVDQTGCASYYFVDATAAFLDMYKRGLTAEEIAHTLRRRAEFLERRAKGKDAEISEFMTSAALCDALQNEAAAAGFKVKAKQSLEEKILLIASAAAHRVIAEGLVWCW